MFPLLTGAAAGTLGAVLGRILAWVGASLIFKVVSAFGVGVVVFYGVGELLDATLLEIQSMTASLPATMAQIVAVLRIDDAITVLFSAGSIRVSLKTFGAAGGIGAVLTRGGPV